MAWMAVYMLLSTDVYRVFAEGNDEGTTDASSVVQPIFTVINLFVTAMQAVGAFLFVKGLPHHFGVKMMPVRLRRLKECLQV